MDLFAPRHLLVILLIVLLVFGTKRIKTLGADLGAAVRGFKRGMSGDNGQPDASALTEMPVDGSAANTTSAVKTDSHTAAQTGSRNTA